MKALGAEPTGIGVALISVDPLPFPLKFPLPETATDPHLTSSQQKYSSDKIFSSTRVECADLQ